MSAAARPGTVLVIGSANADHIARVAQLPAPGQTIHALEYTIVPGGKGANQAIAAAKLDAHVTLLAKTGDDTDGALIRNALTTAGVHLAQEKPLTSHPTGVAIILIDNTGENHITVVPGANSAITPDDVDRILSIDPEELDVIVLQGEISAASNRRAALTAGSRRVILNLAPYYRIEQDTLAVCDPIIVNETEASELVGFPVNDVDTALAALDALHGRARSAVITLGAHGACWIDHSGRGHIPTPAAPTVVDTVGAGDALVGALAAELATGSTLDHALALAVEVATLSVQAAGAQSSYPRRSALSATGRTS